LAFSQRQIHSHRAFDPEENAIASSPTGCLERWKQPTNARLFLYDRLDAKPTTKSNRRRASLRGEEPKGKESS
jgi:hypothetical protein